MHISLLKVMIMSNKRLSLFSDDFTRSHLPFDNCCTSWTTFSKALRSSTGAFSLDAALRNTFKSLEAIFTDVDV